MDSHGSWSVAAAFKLARPAFILEQLAPQMHALSPRQHGCRVVQVEHASARWVGSAEANEEIEQLGEWWCLASQ